MKKVDKAISEELNDTQDQNALMMDANATISELSAEISKICKMVRKEYGKKFPELESLVLNPVDYAKIVIRIGNEMVCPF